MYLKKSEPILLTGSAGGRAKTEPPFRPTTPKSGSGKAKTAKEPEKMSARTLPPHQNFGVGVYFGQKRAFFYFIFLA